MGEAVAGDGEQAEVRDGVSEVVGSRAGEQMEDGCAASIGCDVLGLRFVDWYAEIRPQCHGYHDDLDRVFYGVDSSSPYRRAGGQFAVVDTQVQDYAVAWEHWFDVVASADAERDPGGWRHGACVNRGEWQLQVSGGQEDRLRATKEQVPQDAYDVLF